MESKFFHDPFLFCSNNNMKSYDVFNGDADGICALHQLRLAHPADSILITGVKRDIRLLRKIEDVSDSSITVLDVSLESNREPLNRLLAQKNQLTYIDHHYSGDLPDSPLFTSFIDTAPHLCTSLIVDSTLEGRYRKWAVCGAFGDNLHDSAFLAAQSLSLGEQEISDLRELGELLNYNGYGDTINDLHLPPDTLYRSLREYTDPSDYLSSDTITQLRDGFNNDLALARQQTVLDAGQKNRVYHFPNQPWAKRIVGIFSNLKARQQPDIAHAILIDNDDFTLRISVRAPLNRPKEADTLCRQFPTGGGRSGAAGINNLPADMKEKFIAAFYQLFS